MHELEVDRKSTTNNPANVHTPRTDIVIDLTQETEVNDVDKEDVNQALKRMKRGKP